MQTHPLPCQHNAETGFSLVELSIVLVILGLLTGGILGGQSLIKAAELRSVTKEYEQWQVAVNSFKDKYRGLPGDMQNAAAFWDDTTGGNNDGHVDDAAAASTTGEIFTFWQQLALAGLINGEFTGIAGPGGASSTFMDSIIGENVPASKYSGGGWSVVYTPLSGVYTNDWYSVDFGNMFEFGAKIPGYETGEPLLTPEEAWNIDTKLDDGMPGKGIIIARYWNDRCSQADSTSDLEGVYKLSDDSAQCALAFRKAF